MCHGSCCQHTCRPMTNSADVRTCARGLLSTHLCTQQPPVAVTMRLIRCVANMRHPNVFHGVSLFVYLTVVREALLISDDYHDQFT